MIIVDPYWKGLQNSAGLFFVRPAKDLLVIHLN